MACEYSHRMSGMFGRLAARVGTAACDGYMKELMSAFEPPWLVDPS